MKRWLIIAVLCIGALRTIAQPYGNEWIDYSQQYLKFYVVNDGVYKITYNDLQTVLGSGINTVDPNNIQVWGRGQQQYIHVEGESDNSFDLNDYIEFYAKGNDGWLDTLLYDDPSSQVNPYFSLYNDTATYFITFNATGANNRYTNATSGSVTTPDNYFLEEVIAYNPQQHWQGAYSSSSSGGKHDVDYTTGEGWFYNSYSGNATKTISLSTPNVSTAGSAPDAIIETQYAGVNNPSGSNDHHVEIYYNSQTTPFHNNVFTTFGMFKPSFSIAPSQLSSTTNLIFDNGSSANSASKIAVAYAKIIYPRTYSSITTSQKLIKLPTKGTTHQIQLSSFSNPFSKVYVYDFDNNTRITLSTANVNFTLPAGNERDIFVFSSEAANFNAPVSLQYVKNNGYFRNFLSSDPQNAFVFVTSKLFSNEVNQYANYRASSNGGANDTLTAYVEELYDQFAYGVHKHPLSIRFFADYLADNLTSKPKNLFLIGKSNSYVNSRINSTNYPTAYQQNRVPTMGYPATDNAFTAGLNGTSYEMDIPTGRLASITGSDILLYLDKVKELEAHQNDTITDAIIDKDWMKHVIHFGGGAQVTQQSTFQAYLQNYQATIEDTLFGGYVHEFYKNSSDVIQQNVSAEIDGWIEEGASMITFFGHSSATGFEINIDDPQYYDNQGKYPIFTAFGCQSGDIHNFVDIDSDNSTASERFILTEDRGAIGFLASVDAGIASQMDSFAQYYYRNISVNNYGSSIGEIIKGTVVDFQNPGGCASQLICLNKSTSLEMSLHGDPSIKINPHRLPDYAIELDRVSFSPEVISTDLSSFTMSIDIINLGRAITDSVGVYVVRKVDGFSVDTVFEVLPPIHYNYVYEIEFPTDGGTGSGLNTFDIMVNSIGTAERPITETHYTNNDLLSDNSPSVYISSTDLIPVFPYNYAVVGHNDITLKASTADVFAPSRTYKIQIATDDVYGSPIDETTITQSGGVVSWKPNISSQLTDSAVFFWRCAPTPIDASTTWREHSFQYIAGQTGWGQDDFFQFKNDDFWIVNHNRPESKFEFDTLTMTVSCQTVSNAGNLTELNSTYFSWGGVRMKGGVCDANPSIYVAVFDSLTLEPWEEYYEDAQGVPQNLDRQGWSAYENFGCFGSQSKPIKTFMFPTSGASASNWVDKFTAIVSDSIADGNYILAYTAIRGNFEDPLVWKPSNFSDLESIGCTQLSTGGVLNSDMFNDSPYIFFTKKGSGMVQEVKGDTNQTIALFNAEMNSVVPFGSITSTIIGPAYEWNRLVWEHNPDEIGGVDSVNLLVYVQDTLGNDSLAASYLNQKSGEVLNFNSVVDASRFPYIKLKTEIYDYDLSSSGQLDRWHVLYGGIPEAALDPHTHLTFVSDTLQEGQNLEVSVAIENVSKYDMDSLRVAYWIERNNNKIEMSYPKQDSLRALDVLIDTISYQTLGVTPGFNTLWIEVNPEDEEWQLEQYHFNNITRKTFYVERDITNPLLDVTFDGIHILDGDIVSPEPHIVVELDDENPYIPIADTSSFDLYLTDPNGVQTLLSFTNDQEVLFVEAKLPENKAKVEYTPSFRTDGVYSLTVQGTDASENKAGDFSYSISFEVINKSSITEILNYPNPFSTSTRFVFVLTGSKIPDSFKIQILTASGKVVREITEDEIGPINIGRNISQYAWDGTDEFGDPLANGVYVYRVISKINGQEIERRSSGADDFFHKGFGKMYLMR